MKISILLNQATNILFHAMAMKKAYEHIEDYSSKAKNFEEAKQSLYLD